jgi:hypothetical protein
MPFASGTRKAGYGRLSKITECLMFRWWHGRVLLHAAIARADLVKDLEAGLAEFSALADSLADLDALGGGTE